MNWRTVSKKTGVVFLLIFLSLSTARAADDFAARFLKAGASIPSALEKKGYRNFGGTLNLQELKKGMRAVRISQDIRIGRRNTQGRVSARWECEVGSCSITVNPKWWAKFPEQQPILALHEYLGALGFFDDNYWISTSMWFLSLPETHQALGPAFVTSIEG